MTTDLSVPDSLAQIRIVLVRPQHPGNIGSVARVMKNMGLAELALVAPQRFPHPQAKALASGAMDVLENARVFIDLREAVADRERVIGTSARLRSLPHNMTTPRELARALARRRRWPRTAVVFGPERIGLTNEELDLCQTLLTIPTDAQYAALNLATAAGIVCYELRMAARPEIAGAPARAPVVHAELERFYEHLEQVLARIGFLDPANPRFLMRRLRRLFGRAEPDDNEVNILRGILTETERSIGRKLD